VGAVPTSSTKWASEGNSGAFLIGSIRGKWSRGVYLGVTRQLHRLKSTGVTKRLSLALRSLTGRIHMSKDKGRKEVKKPKKAKIKV
jgi:hypothetical protein